MDRAAGSRLQGWELSVAQPLISFFLQVTRTLLLVVTLKILQIQVHG